MVNTGEEISHPLGALAGPLGAHRHGLEPEKGLFRQKSLSAFARNENHTQTVCDFQLIFATKGPQLHGTWTQARGNLAILKTSIFLSVYVFVVYRET